MQLTKVFVWLCLVIPASAQNNHTMICYTDSSMQNLPFPTHPLLCTHVIYSAGYIGHDSTFKTQDLDNGFTLMRTLKHLKHRNPTLKTLLGVKVKRSRLEMISESQSTLDNFISSALNYVKEKNYDGLELTWLTTSETLSNTETLTRFLKALRERIDADLAIKETLLVLVSLLDGTHMDNQTLAQYVDFISLLPLNPNTVREQTDNTVQYWQDQGVEPKMLILTLPALVRWPSNTQTDINSTDMDMNPVMEKTNGPELIMANQICQALKSEQKELNTLTKLESVQSHGEEVAWLLEKGIGGVGVVFVDIDKFGNSTGDGCTQSQMAALESKVITVFPHRTHLRHGHHHCHHHHRHHHRHHQHGYRHHEHPHQDQCHHGLHRHGHRHHEHLHHGHSQHGHGHHRHGHGHHRHGHKGRFHYGHH